MQIRTILYTIILLNIPVLLSAQLTAPAADTGMASSYNVSSVIDSVFIFGVDNNQRYVKFSPKDASTPVDAIEWMYFSDGAYQGISSLPALTDSLMIDTLTGSIGLQVKYTQGAMTDSVRCWMYIDDFTIEIRNKDEFDTLRAGFDCNRITEMEAKIYRNNYRYYNPYTGQMYNYIKEYDVTWTRQPNAGSEPRFLGGNKFKVAIDDPYWQNTTYTITVTSPIGNTQIDKVVYKSVRPFARLVAEYIPVSDELGTSHPNYENYSKRKGEKSAPATYMFWSESKNTDRSNLYLFADLDGDDVYTKGNDSLLYTAQTTNDTIYYTFRFPGEKYRAQLKAEKDVEIWSQPCLSDTSISDIVVDPPKLTIMNVFSVGSDQVFRFNEESIEAMHIEIFNRFGKRVYKYEGDLRNWEGWDGRLNNSSNYAQTGVYYYVIQWRNVLQDFQLYLPEGHSGAIASQAEREALYVQGKDLYQKGDERVFKGFVHVFNSDNK